MFVNEAQRMIHGKGTAGTKKLAAQNCALSLVRQLFHLGVLESAEAGQVQAKKAKIEEVSILLLCSIFLFLFFCIFFKFSV